MNKWLAVEIIRINKRKVFMESILEKIFLGAIGGAVAYWIAYRKFISQRWWDKRFDLYSSAIDILKQIEHSLAVYEWALENKQTIDNSEAVKNAFLEFEDGLSQLHGLQSKMLLIGLDEAHHKLLPLSAGLQAVHPSYLTSTTDEDRQELIDLVKQSKSMVGGCSGELAFQGKATLETELHFIKKLKSLFRKLT